jgi:predicted transcriptional regulator
MGQVSIYLSPDLIDRIDRAAHRRAMSRSQFISVMLSRAVEQDDDWPSFFWDHLAESARTANAKEQREKGEEEGK